MFSPTEIRPAIHHTFKPLIHIRPCQQAKQSNPKFIWIIPHSCSFGGGGHSQASWLNVFHSLEMAFPVSPSRWSCMEHYIAKSQHLQGPLFTLVKPGPEALHATTSAAAPSSSFLSSNWSYVINFWKVIRIKVTLSDICCFLSTDFHTFGYFFFMGQSVTKIWLFCKLWMLFKL